ncbi:porin [Salipiger bermudensis]|uniref:porin n=1 Tax=Salipiger bermudensis TaxID=344736 RepID=UPI001CD4F2C7|nr:porin [Salipiger bermudensis]MCA0963754.1 porin [Salipiger bermudensis]
MKSILFATTALVATAGVASAEIALTGNAEMGIYAPVDVDVDGDREMGDTQFFTDMDIRFTLSGEADNGLTFGATIDLDEAADNNNPGRFENPNQQGGEAIFISYGGATFTMGDTDGALDARVPEMALAAGSLNDDETIHLGFNHGDGLSDSDGDGFTTVIEDGVGLSLDGFGDGQVARIDYAYDAFTFSASMEQVADGADVEDLGDTIWGIGVAYSGQLSTIDLTVGLGYQTLDEYADVTSVGATGGFGNGFSAGLTYTDMSIDGGDDIEHWGVGFGYEMNAIAVGMNYGEYTQDDDKLSGFGLAASYDLGGGLSARLGYGYSDIDPDGASSDDYDTYSLGLSMNF